MHSNTQWNFEILFGFQLLPRPDMIFIRWTSKRLRKLRSFPAHRETLLLLARRHLLPTLKNALLFARAQMGGFGLGEQVVRVKVILFIGLSPPGNTNVHTVEATARNSSQSLLQQVVKLQRRAREQPFFRAVLLPSYTFAF